MAGQSEQDPGYTAKTYFDLVRRGVLEEDDRVELLDGLIVASPPQNPEHASVIMCVDDALRRVIGEGSSIRIQMPLLVGDKSVPEPDLAVVTGKAIDFRSQHPQKALLVVEVSDSSLPQDRLTKSRIYAQAEIAEYWILNLRSRALEIYTQPDSRRRVYVDHRTAHAGEVVELVELRGASIAVADLFPGY